MFTWRRSIAADWNNVVSDGESDGGADQGQNNKALKKIIKI